MSDRRAWATAWLAAGAFFAAWVGVLFATPLADRYAFLPTPLAILGVLSGLVGLGYLAAAVIQR